MLGPQGIHGPTVDIGRIYQGPWRVNVWSFQYVAEKNACWGVQGGITRAVWQRSAPMPIQLAHAGGVANDLAPARTAVADHRAHSAAVPRNLGVGRHAGPVTQHHCHGGTEVRGREQTAGGTEARGLPAPPHTEVSGLETPSAYQLNYCKQSKAVKEKDEVATVMATGLASSLPANGFLNNHNIPLFLCDGFEE